LGIPHELPHAQRLRGIACGDQAHGLLIQVAAPYPVVAVVEVSPVGEIAPWHSESCDAGPAKRFVFGGV
jgi:hypothetical protein